MARHILLMKLTEQGAKDIKGAPQRIEQSLKAYEKMGGNPIHNHNCPEPGSLPGNGRMEPGCSCNPGYRNSCNVD